MGFCKGLAFVKPLFFMRTLLRIFFHLLYHQFAFTYDLIAAIVSFGRWKDWIQEVVPFIEGTRTLEIGHGPGHLQRVLLNRGLVAVAIDESAPMGRLAKRNTDGKAHLTRGLAQHLPFSDESFDTVIATFPAEYIFDPATLTETYRVLKKNGRFVILPGVVITGRRIWERCMAWLFRVTGQTPPNLSEILRERSKEPFAKAGFQVEVQELEVKSSTVFIVGATKSTNAQVAES